MFVGAIDSNNKTEPDVDECYTTLEVEGHSIKFKIDTGSQVNIQCITTVCLQATS